MLRIRFLRVGKKNRPSFRLVVTPRRTAPKSGRFLEILGFYNPIEHVGAFKKERIQYWLSQGAQPSDGARNMLISEGVMEGAKVAVHKRPSKKKEEGEEGSATAAESDSEKEKGEVAAEGKKESDSGAESPTSEAPATGEENTKETEGEPEKNQEPADSSDDTNKESSNEASPEEDIKAAKSENT